MSVCSDKAFWFAERAEASQHPGSSAGSRLPQPGGDSVSLRNLQTTDALVTQNRKDAQIWLGQGETGRVYQAPPLRTRWEESLRAVVGRGGGERGTRRGRR